MARPTHPAALHSQNPHQPLATGITLCGPHDRPGRSPLCGLPDLAKAALYRGFRKGPVSNRDLRDGDSVCLKTLAGPKLSTLPSFQLCSGRSYLQYSELSRASISTACRVSPTLQSARLVGIEPGQGALSEPRSAARNPDLRQLSVERTVYKTV